MLSERSLVAVAAASLGVVLTLMLRKTRRIRIAKSILAVFFFRRVFSSHANLRVEYPPRNKATFLRVHMVVNNPQKYGLISPTRVTAFRGVARIEATCISYHWITTTKWRLDEQSSKGLNCSCTRASSQMSLHWLGWLGC